ncbi:MAG: DsrE family protein [Gemmatimonadota bacterium]
MAKSYLFVLNDAPYGNESAYNALRWAAALGKREAGRVRLFLQGDAVGCALAGQETPDGFYNVGRMIRLLTARGAVAT